MELEEGTVLFRDRNVFMISFLLNGMSFVDIANLKLSNIVDGRIRYARQKTDEPFNIKIHRQLAPILDYFTQEKEKSDYLLDIIEDANPIDQYNKITWAR